MKGTEKNMIVIYRIELWTAFREYKKEQLLVLLVPNFMIFYFNIRGKMSLIRCFA